MVQYCRQTQLLAPCILLISAQDSAGRVVLLGVFLSCALSPPSPGVRGDGMCFCFRLDEGGARCHRWVGHEMDSVQALSSTQLQFAVCSGEYMSFGGSAECGTNALWLSGDLSTCETGASDTYHNAPMVGEESGGSGGATLVVLDVEVFCGKIEVAKRRQRGGD